jgi:hypothetical protein
LSQANVDHVSREAHFVIPRNIQCGTFKYAFNIVHSDHYRFTRKNRGLANAADVQEYRARSLLPKPLNSGFKFRQAELKVWL